LQPFVISLRKYKKQKNNFYKNKAMKNLVNIAQQPQPQHQHQPMVNGESMSIKNDITLG